MVCSTNDSAGTGGTPKWRGTISADYTAGPASFTVQGRWFGSSKNTNTANTGNLSTAQTVNLYPADSFEIPVVAYLDLRGSYKWDDNLQLYAAVDNVTNVPPPNIPSTQAQGQNAYYFSAIREDIYDAIGRQYRVGVRFNY